MCTYDVNGFNGNDNEGQKMQKPNEVGKRKGSGCIFIQKHNLGGRSRQAQEVDEHVQIIWLLRHPRDSHTKIGDGDESSQRSYGIAAIRMRTFELTENDK